MKVKIKDQVFDSAVEPIMIVLEGNEKQLIASMTEEDKRFCVFPDDLGEEEALRFMQIVAE